MSKYGGALSSSQVALARARLAEGKGLPFREAFGSEHIQNIFHRHTPEGARERVFPPADDDHGFS